jgi:hypothetical protein
MIPYYRPFLMWLMCACLFLYPNTDALSEVIVNNRPLGMTTVAPAVDPQTGAVVHSIPIEVPPGINGIQPDIALTYSSGRPLSFLGTGWTLELGAIERSTSFGPPSYDDAKDRFVLVQEGGAQNLFYDANTGFYRTQDSDKRFMKDIRG